MLTASYGNTAERHQVLVSGSVTLLAAAAWLALWMMSGSAHASMHHHHHSANQAVTLPSALLFVGGWTVMTIAMMLPTTLPVLTTFHAIAGQRADRTLLLALVALGYLVTWALFGVVVQFSQLALHQVSAGNAWLQPTAVSDGLILILAGAYQFTPLKHRCLEKCRSPLSFVIEHWQGRRERAQALRLGFDHGLFCVGFCWALMLPMFVVGMTNLSWMLILGVVMAVEKNNRWGRRLSMPLGVAVLGWGVTTLVA